MPKPPVLQPQGLQPAPPPPHYAQAPMQAVSLAAFGAHYAQPMPQPQGLQPVYAQYPGPPQQGVQYFAPASAGSISYAPASAASIPYAPAAAAAAYMNVPAPAPSAWRAVSDGASGATYFYNTSTGQSQWEHPDR